ncbi:MAG: hypothetical protein RL131_606 [Bacteroidota bacterium]
MKALLTLFCAWFALTIHAQEAAPVLNWNITTQKVETKKFKLRFELTDSKGWEVFTPDMNFDGLAAAGIELSDGTVKIIDTLKWVDGKIKNSKSQIFEGQSVTFSSTGTAWEAQIEFSGDVPEQLLVNLNYSFGKDASGEFYQETAKLEARLEGGKKSENRIVIQNLDINKPLQDCNIGEQKQAESGPLKIFFLGFLGGLFALLTPCVFPMVPLTVSYFTKHSANKSKGKQLAALYGLFIFLIYVSFSIPFHLIGNVSPTIYNDIATNVYLNVAFFAIFIFFAISFFGYFEITLPGSLANSANAKQGSGIMGVFFMALTLTIVSFSCTGPILGTLLVGTATEGAWPLTAGLAGFGVALGLPFGLFALFPQWLNSLPKSGSWLNTVKVVLGFIELALALKFLSNADLVAHWSLIKREVFFGVWILIFLGLFIYLMGWLHFPHDSKGQKISAGRKVIAFAVLIFLFYLSPGLTNTKSANLSLVSGFPPPVCYSLYANPINCDEPYKDYEEALAVAKQQNKPLLIDFTGWACVNCRKMEENVWTKPEVQELMEQYILVSLYVDDKENLPVTEQRNYTTKSGAVETIRTVGNKWSLFQTENFNATSQPWYVALSPSEQLLTPPVGYTPNPGDFAAWLRCGLETFKANQ